MHVRYTLDWLNAHLLHAVKFVTSLCSAIKSPLLCMYICTISVTSCYYYIKVSPDRDKVYLMHKQQEEKWRKKVIELQVL